MCACVPCVESTSPVSCVILCKAQILIAPTLSLGERQLVSGQGMSILHLSNDFEAFVGLVSCLYAFAFIEVVVFVLLFKFLLHIFI